MVILLSYKIMWYQYTQISSGVLGGLFFWCSTPSLLNVVNLAEPQHCTILTPEFSHLSAPWNIASYHIDLSYASGTKFLLVAHLFWQNIQNWQKSAGRVPQLFLLFLFSEENTHGVIKVVLFSTEVTSELFPPAASPCFFHNCCFDLSLG